MGIKTKQQIKNIENIVSLCFSFIKKGGGVSSL